MSETPELKVVELYTSKSDSDEKVIAALETMLERAKAGQVHSLVVVGVDHISGDVNRFMHRAFRADVIGAMSTTLHKMQAQYNDGEEF